MTDLHDSQWKAMSDHIFAILKIYIYIYNNEHCVKNLKEYVRFRMVVLKSWLQNYDNP